MTEQEFAADDAVDADDRAKNPEALRNIRLWDHRPLRDTLNTIQTIRPLYVFPDVDVDRYQIAGETQQVFLAARELSQSNLQTNQQGWVNRRLQFTHGFGVTVTPVDEVNSAGGPNFFVSNIPPETAPLPPDSDTFEITQPRIYFGEVTDPYVIVNSNSEEFDFPLTGGAPVDDGTLNTESQATNRYDGSGGIALGGFLRRLIFSWAFSDTNILISGSVTSESRLLFHRNIQERVQELAPFLELDADPYIVVGEEGRLWWIQDAYTTTTRYPYSQPHERGVNNIDGRVNYIRNSVKVVIDAYNGSVALYVVDPTDPIIQVWQDIFPDLFQPGEAFPADLRAHWRYPQDLFQIQAEQYLTYHITVPRTLFNREDVWDTPRELLRDQTVPVEPYYVTLRLPDAPDPEFLLILPFTPRNRINAIAWLAGRSDGEHYGTLFAFRFPANKNVDGPEQIEARIDQDVSISRQFTLLGQRGSRLIRGNLLFIPVGDSFVYVEPIFLESETTRFPQLKGVIVVNGDRVALEDTLERAVAVALGERSPQGLSFVGGASAEEAAIPAEAGPSAADGAAGAATTPPAAPTTAADALPETVPGLIDEARDAFAEAQRRLAAQDFAGYGEQLERLERALEALDRVIAAQETP